jgi:hypothetical protein
MIGNIIPEPFFEDFQDQAFKDYNSKILIINKASHLEHFAPIVIFSIYSVELELHDRKVCVALLC